MDGMARGFPAADSSSPVSVSMVQAAAALFGQTPAAWGRYFTSPTTAGTVEYRHAQENAVLAQYGIRLLPIARQTKDVGGTAAQGTSDAEGNVDDLFATFGADYLASLGGELLMFLDVEGTPASGSPSLALDYYLGWGQTLASASRAASGGRVTVLPCVYARQGDDATWTVLEEAAAQGVPCQGAWVARYYYSSCALTDWDDAIVTPTVAIPCPILLWQYAENCCNGAIDCSQTNPALDIQTALLQRLILPPAPG
jgi:hypothetical protein